MQIYARSVVLDPQLDAMSVVCVTSVIWAIDRRVSGPMKLVGVGLSAPPLYLMQRHLNRVYWGWEKRKYLPEKMLDKPEMKSFRQTLETRQKEFGDHRLLLVTSTGRAEPVQWYKALPVRGSIVQQLPYVQHPDLKWHRKDLLYPNERWDLHEAEDDIRGDAIRLDLPREILPGPYIVV